MHHDFVHPSEMNPPSEDMCDRGDRYYDHNNKQVSCTWIASVMDYWCDDEKVR